MASESPINFFVRQMTLTAICLFPYVISIEADEANDSSVARRTLPRTPPPQRWDSETESLFEGDPRRRLKGTPPSDKSAGTPQPLKPLKQTNDMSPPSWTPLILAEAVEDEIKRLYTAMQKPLSRIGSYKSGGHQIVSEQFALVATMFEILARHREHARWKDIATDAASHFSVASRESQMSNLQAFQNAKSHYEDLGQLIRGERVDISPASPLTWSEMIERPALMRRLAQGYADGLKSWSFDADEFEKNRMSLIQEARIHAVLAQIMQQPSYEFSDDDDYRSHGERLKIDAQQIVQAAEERNLEQVQHFVGQLNKTCSRCHEAYK